MADIISDGITAKPSNPAFRAGNQRQFVDFYRAFTDANSADGDIVQLAGPLTYNDRIVAIRPRGAGTPAMTAADDVDLGFYYKDGDGDFVVIDKDIMWDGVDLSSALTHNEFLFALNASLNRYKTIGELLGKGNDELPFGGVYLCLTFVASTSASVTLDLQIEIDKDNTNQ